jgi:glycine cleavage system aminomethyltransferase T
MGNAMPNESPFHHVHVNSGAVMAERDGWLMPRHYGDPAAEGQAARERLAVFDVSHRSRFRLAGAGAAAVLEQLTGEGAARLYEGRQRLLTLHLHPDDTGIPCTIQHQEGSFLLIGPPFSHAQIHDRLTQGNHNGPVKVTDETGSTAMVLLRGPAAVPLLKEKLPFEGIADLQPGDVLCTSYFFMRFVIALDEGTAPDATIIMPAKVAGLAWDMLQKYGKSYGAALAGLEALEL